MENVKEIEGIGNLTKEDLSLYERFKRAKRIIKADKNRRADIDNSVFYQKETFTTTNEVDEYDFRLNNNFKYCHGFIILDVSGLNVSLIAFKQKGAYTLDRVPSVFSVCGRSEFTKKKFPLNLIAAGTQHKLYFDKNGDTKATLDILFILSNNKIEDVKKNFGYTYVSAPTGATTTGFLDIDTIHKRLKGIAFVFKGGSATSSVISIYDDSLKYIDGISGAEFNALAVDDIAFEDKLIKIDIPAGYVSYSIENSTGTNANIFIIYEYE